MNEHAREQQQDTTVEEYYMDAHYLTPPALQTLRSARHLCLAMLLVMAVSTLPAATAIAGLTPTYESRLRTPVRVSRLVPQISVATADTRALITEELESLYFPEGARLPLHLEIVTDSVTDNATESGTVAATSGGDPRLRGHDAFLIEVAPAAIRIRATTPAGLWYGLDQLKAELRAGNGRLGHRYIFDGGDHAIRAFHMVLRSMSVEEVRRVIRLARQHRFNTLVLLLADGVRLDADAVTPRPDAISAEDLRDLAVYSRAQGMRFVPEMSLLTHQGRFFRDRHPDLMLNEQTYDPRKDEVYRLVFDYLDEVIRLTEPDAIHIGHDEVAGTYNLKKKKRRLPEDQVLPPELFLADIVRLHEYLSERGHEVWMWGDMLVSADEVDKPDDPNLHGGAGHARIRPDLPRDIVICDWHYWDKSGSFPSAKLLVSEGFRVLGATWKKREVTRGFSSYVAQLGPAAPGMIATTWRHVQKREWPVVEKIATDSGAAFWRVPDSR